MPGCDYLGLRRYQLTICAKWPGVPFREAAVVARCLEQLRQLASHEEFALPAYCFMPDHAHLVIEGRTPSSVLRRFVARWKQETAYWFSCDTGRPLWLPGYHDIVLRDTQSTVNTVRYVLENPVRAGLARRIGEYHFAGSDVYTEEELRELVEQWIGDAQG
jgi:putative transposase